MTEQDLKSVSTHFAFGENWSSYAETIDDQRIDEAIAGLKKLVGDDLSGLSFLDIGCGSGLHSLAAHRLSAARVVSLDIDKHSVETTQTVLEKLGNQQIVDVRAASVFDLSPESMGEFDLVYSWGVLHHTGDMAAAVAKAAALVKPGGRFVFALYRQTHLCPFWKVEKRWYSRAKPKAQQRARKLYTALMRIAFFTVRRDFKDYVDSYQSSRGMNYEHDVHDWLGGYPYESIGAADVAEMMGGLGFMDERAFTQPKSLGIFGSGCDEFVYVRQ
jgi:2-polyprenyl-6-hydroxyphenyl methylase/3-demethylubiquinone-9 3-methyltransferase